jgi:acyl-homoserine-lactone acylase
MDLYGATLVGSPIITIGFNDQLAWTHTVNTHDGQDLYELTLDGGDAYRWNGASRRLDVRAETLSVKQADGRMVKKPLVFRASVHGPVVAEQPGKALALRVVGLDRPGAWKEWWDMGRARSLPEFRKALGEMQIPMFTVMYADRAGHIMHLFGGLTPVRSRGDWAYWQGIVRGDSASTLWTAVHPLGELPVVVDPATGWLQNANDPPWTTTVPLALDPSKYPSYMAPRGMAFRPQRSAKLLAADGPLTFDQLLERKHSTRMELADRLLDDLLPAARERGNESAKRAADVLAAWDRTADPESKGGVLFMTWWSQLGRQARGSPFAIPWDARRPLETPDGLANPAMAVTALETAAAEVVKRHGALDVAWGKVYRLRRDAIDLPANGGTGGLGIFRVTEFDENEETTQAPAMGGDSFVAAVEFSAPLTARTLVGYGNWSQPGTHRSDQMALYARKELRTAWRTRAEIESNLEKRETIK